MWVSYRRKKVAVVVQKSQPGGAIRRSQSAQHAQWMHRSSCIALTCRASTRGPGLRGYGYPCRNVAPETRNPLHPNTLTTLTLPHGAQRVTARGYGVRGVTSSFAPAARPSSSWPSALSSWARRVCSAFQRSSLAPAHLPAPSLRWPRPSSSSSTADA